MDTPGPESFPINSSKGNNYCDFCLLPREIEPFQRESTFEWKEYLLEKQILLFKS